MNWSSFLKKKPVASAVIDPVINNPVSPLNDYNAAIFGWLNNNQPLYYDDRARTYVEEGYMGTPDIYVCINKIITKLAMCPLVLYEVASEDIGLIQKYKNLMNSYDIQSKAQAKLIEIKSMKKVYEPTISKILQKPNPNEMISDFIKGWAGFKLITGNTYIYLNGPNPDAERWSEMFVLPAHYMEIVSGGPWQPVKGYRLLGQGHYYQSENIAFTANRVKHTKTFNPDYQSTGSQMYGMAPLRAFLITMYKNRAAKKEQARQMNNGGSYGFVGPDKDGVPINSTQSDDLKASLKRAKLANDISDRIFVSSGPLRWQQVGLPSVELQLIEALGLDQKDFCNCYNVPIQLMNNDNASTDNNMQWAGKQFIYNAIMPEANELGDTLTDALCGRLNAMSHKTGKYYAVIQDTTGLPEMQEDMQKVADWLLKSDWLTYNEKREVMGFGKSILPGTDELFIDSNKILLKDAIAFDTQITDAPVKVDPKTNEPQL
jgi:HK97 family phage portal protein